MTVTAPNPRIVIDCPPGRSGNGRACNVQVTGFDDPDDVAAVLLIVVERITGVRVDSYLHLVDECRRIAAREQATENATPDGAAASSPAAEPQTPGRATRALPVARPGTNPEETT